ncbi:hypothetical protein VDGE_07557 [Verticillium dahliae]|uniref:Major facilitator superfamily (MFS) profile domain-containing protein n=1 Tax=Verticillium dahliae TaxID=27337 RepID=A0A444RLB9_VERDA|nr:hypothetical protein VDGE_07557 [Verticillium dahliae]
MVANSKASAVMSHKLDAEHTENALVIEQVAEGETTLWTSIKENPRAIMLAFLANCGSVLFGYDILIQGAITALPMFSIAFGSPFGDDIILPALWQGVWQGFNAIGIMIGAASNGVVMGRFGRKNHVCSVAGVGASVACTLISWFIIAKIGRRTAILALRFIGVALVMAACCSNLGTGTAYPIVAAEIPATRLRAKTLGSGFAVNAFMMWAFKFVVPYMFNADQGNLGGTIGPVFAGFCVVGFVDSFFEIPETKDITYSRINALFQTRTPARGFRAMAVSYEAENMAGTGDA